MPIADISDFQLQDDLSKVMNWCSKWSLQLSVAKCACLHFGWNNPNFSYTTTGNIAIAIADVVDLGILIDRNLKPVAQCYRAAARAQRMLSIINRSTTLGVFLLPQKF